MLMSAVLACAAMASASQTDELCRAMRGRPMEEKPEPTKHDLDRLAAAKARRERKAARKGNK